jgi:hypothetical protein
VGWQPKTPWPNRASHAPILASHDQRCSPDLTCLAFLFGISMFVRSFSVVAISSHLITTQSNVLWTVLAAPGARAPEWRVQYTRYQFFTSTGSRNRAKSKWLRSTAAPYLHHQQGTGLVWTFFLTDPKPLPGSLCRECATRQATEAVENSNGGRNGHEVSETEMERLEARADMFDELIDTIRAASSQDEARLIATIRSSGNTQSQLQQAIRHFQEQSRSPAVSESRCVRCGRSIRHQGTPASAASRSSGDSGRQS